MNSTIAINVTKKVNAPVKEEEKKEAPKTGLYTTKPSERIRNIKTSDPFAAKTNVKKLKILFFIPYQYLLATPSLMFIMQEESLVELIMVLQSIESNGIIM